MERKTKSTCPKEETPNKSTCHPTESNSSCPAIETTSTCQNHQTYLEKEYSKEEKLVDIFSLLKRIPKPENHPLMHTEVDGYSFASMKDLSNITTTRVILLSDNTFAEIDNFSNKIIRKQLTSKELALHVEAASPYLPVPQLFAYNQRQEFDHHIAANIVEAITEGHTIQSISKTNGMPSAGTIGRWRIEYPEFDEAIRKAREIRAEHFHDHIVATLETEDNLDFRDVPSAKLKFEKLKWLASVNDSKTFAASKNEKKSNTAPTVIIDTGI